MKTQFIKISIALLLGLASLAPSLVSAQGYPSKPVRIIVPVAAGGNLDLITRSVAQRLGEELKQSVVVENRPGAALLPGTQYAAKQPPDGYTLLAMANTTVTAPAIIPNPGYDPVKDFTAIGLMAKVPMVLVVGPSVKVANIQELVKLAKERPDSLTGATAGGGSSAHIAAEMFFQQAGIRSLLISYKGNAPALIDIIGGRVDYIFDAVTTTIQFINSGQLRPLATTGSTRSVLLPNVPTVAESGLPEFQTEIFNGLVAPAGTPRDTIRRLHAALQRAVANPELKAQYRAQGVELATNRTPEEFDTFIRQEVDRYAKLAKAANIKAD